MQNMKFLYRITGKGMVNSYGQYCGGRPAGAGRAISQGRLQNVWVIFMSIPGRLYRSVALHMEKYEGGYS